MEMKENLIVTLGSSLCYIEEIFRKSNYLLKNTKLSQYHFHVRLYFVVCMKNSLSVIIH